MRRSLTFLALILWAFAPLCFAQLPDVIDLADVGTAAVPGTKIDGVGTDDRLGHDLGAAGDLNGDGFEDLLVGSPLSDPMGRVNAGRSWILWGSADGLGAMGSLPLQNLTANEGTVILGSEGMNGMDDSGGQEGHPHGLGDLNGDGFPELAVIGNRVDTSNGFNTGRATVFWGGPSMFGGSGTYDLAAFNSADGFQISGREPLDWLQITTGVGDFNGDGFADFRTFSYQAERLGVSDVGEAYLVFGSPSIGQNGVVDLNMLDGENGVLIMPPIVGDVGGSGGQLAGVGDLNGDGYDDVTLGLRTGLDHANRPFAGGLYVILGGEEPLAIGGTLDLGSLSDERIFYVQGSEMGRLFGVHVTAAGDFNGDGFDDILLGSPTVPRYGVANTGEAWLLLGGEDLFSHGHDIEVSDLSAGSATQILSDVPAESFGQAISGVGDLNGDGYTEIGISGHSGSGNWGSRTDSDYLLYGSDAAFGDIGVFDMASFEAVAGVRLNEENPNDGIGRNITAAGDVDGDGLNDFAVTSWLANGAGGTDSGRVYLIHSQETQDVATYHTWLRPGEAPIRGVGMVRNGSHSIPFSRCWLGFFRGEGDGVGGASHHAVTLSRTGDEIANLGNHASVMWSIESEREGPVFLRARFKYLDSEIAGLDEGRLAAFWAPEPDGPWKRVPIQSLQAECNRISVALPVRPPERRQTVHFAIAERLGAGNPHLPSQALEALLGRGYGTPDLDFNLDGPLDSGDLILLLEAESGL